MLRTRSVCFLIHTVTGYLTWFDLNNLKGATIDAMSDAIDRAAVMIYAVSLRYKESVNVRRQSRVGASVLLSE